MEIGIPISFMRVQQLFYLDRETIDIEKHIGVFDRGLESKFNSLPSYNTNYVADEDPTDVLDLDFEEKSFEAKFNWCIENKTVLQETYYH